MIIEVNDFLPEHTFECGQCFRWTRIDENKYEGVAGERAVTISYKDNLMEIDCSEEDFNSFWKDYLDLERDYKKIKDTLCKNDTMNKAIAFGHGIRILRQEFSEALISFIISQRSSIPKIKSCIEKLCRGFGEPITYNGKTLYAFPTVDVLSSMSEDDFRALGVGYRAPYLVDASKKLKENQINFDILNGTDTLLARNELLKIKGVGDKVCDCVLLFSLGKFDLFPSDVWIKRVMEEEFQTTDAKGTGESVFGLYSGFAQQYLFYWRKGKINK